MARYRFLNPAVHGTWFPSREEAVEEAIRAGLARREPDGEITWIDSTRIEERPSPSR